MKKKLFKIFPIAMIGSLIIACVLSIYKEGTSWNQSYYYESGNLKKIVNYKGQNFHGTSTLFANTKERKKLMEVTYNNGEKSGTWTTWDESGKIMEQVQYDK